METEIFEYWCEVMKKSKNTKFSPARRKKVKARLDDGFSVDDIKKAIKGCSKSKFHQGENPSRTVYNELTLICRNVEKVEFFMECINVVEQVEYDNKPRIIESAEQKMIKKETAKTELSKLKSILGVRK